MAEMAQWGPTPVSATGDPQLARVTVVSETFFEVMGGTRLDAPGRLNNSRHTQVSDIG